ncbi:DUF5683 domain-containing protein [Cardinium endosymbiont of Sogatella furcifera]|uniref:DUF5683 domain-containing protein n=1 Tax=Cardinium endosymbiont of Sogatella furcifera TaxID=650378 RepID=UPI0013B3C103|nr:DUF5683 domain-containing protein [Cardinium endosymbiont of Sogatella furcifera]
MVVIGLYFSCLTQAIALPYQPGLPGLVNGAPRCLYAVQHKGNDLSPGQGDHAALLYKTMPIEAMIQRSWLASMVVPGLGQVYNKDYWKVPCLYVGFALVGARIYSEHQEMNDHKRTLLMTGKDKPNPAFTEKRIKECARTRDLFIIIAIAWYIFNILDAYAGGHGTTVNFIDNIGTISPSKPAVALQPTAASSIAKRAVHNR